MITFYKVNKNDDDYHKTSQMIIISSLAENTERKRVIEIDLK